RACERKWGGMVEPPHPVVFKRHKARSYPNPVRSRSIQSYQPDGFAAPAPTRKCPVKVSAAPVLGARALVGFPRPLSNAATMQSLDSCCQFLYSGVYE